MQNVSTNEIPTIEWLTLAMVAMNYAAWWGLLQLYGTAPIVVMPLLGLCLAMQLSLQHELIHGHPTRHVWINDLLGSPPITLIFPYWEYKRSHLAHHQDELLTIPETDPESFFHTAESWQQMSTPRRALHWTNMTLLGRLILNPLRSAANMTVLAATQFRGGSARERFGWLLHFVGIGAVLWLVGSVYGVPIWAYLMAVHIGHALISLRSFFEHRIADEPSKRIVIVESNRFFRLLFLCNNFHAVHHRHPGLPWYRIEKRYRNDQEDIMNSNGGFHFRGYGDWLRYLVKPVSSPVHPARLAAPES